ncbi:RBBP9/YdeN family alpha/beta hydrolase [Martelella alba]|uniref:Alpha/beta hydrolase n=1 Tax=Martelella alba TaxID=2590451 RepID=A0ABY2SMV5_9HYPH|nr:alpha/beta hydrolase [Martelella alba]TKI06553.1 alpha/beta hydrolase [Martelella alba]
MNNGSLARGALWVPGRSAQKNSPDRALTADSGGERVTVLLVPGIQDSGPEHWQSYWQRQRPSWQRIAQRNWLEPDLDGWLAAIRRALSGQERRALLIGHSFGALSACYFARQNPGITAGVVLVAPAEPARFAIEERIVAAPLPVPSLLVASHNDPLLTFDRARYWAQAWGSELMDIGEAGHINAQAGFGPWAHGLSTIENFIRTF